MESKSCSSSFQRGIFDTGPADRTQPLACHRRAAPCAPLRTYSESAYTRRGGGVHTSPLKSSEQQQATLHISNPYLPPSASGSTLLTPSFALTHGLPQSTVWAPNSPMAQGTRATSGHALPNVCSFGPKTAIVCSKQPEKTDRGSKMTEYGWHILRPLGFPVGSLWLYNMSKKRPKSGPKWPKIWHFGCQQPRTKDSSYLALRVSQSRFEGTQSTHKPPLLVVSLTPRPPK